MSCQSRMLGDPPDGVKGRTPAGGPAYPLAMQRLEGTLYVVATPLGNLQDITLRALAVLREVDVVACEDTRRTGQLLAAHGIATRTTSYFEHNARWKGDRILE